LSQSQINFRMSSTFLMHNNSARCPACTSSALTDKGALPKLQPHIFGGVEIDPDTVLEAGHLFHCRNCDLHFRHPCLSQSSFTKLYEGLLPTVWECNKPRPYWPLVLELMEQYSANRIILDVGCFRGDFLSWLPVDWRKMGIEPNVGARQVALVRGIDVIGDDVDQVHSSPEPVGVITIIDVLEHIVDPLTVLRGLTKLLECRGSIIVLTGAVDTLPWRVFGADYWYCSLPEHLSFFTLKWFRWAGKQLGLSVVWFRYLSSDHAALKKSLEDFMRLFAYTVVRRLRRSGMSERTLSRLPLMRRVVKWSLPPWWREAKDHILVVLKKQ